MNHRSSSLAGKILSLLRAGANKWTAAEIIDRLNIDEPGIQHRPEAVRSAISRLVKDGQARRVGTRYIEMGTGSGAPEIPVQRIPVAAAKRIAEAYGYEQVVIYARKTGDCGKEHMTTYGTTKQHCGIAAKMAATLQKLMGWDPTP